MISSYLAKFISGLLTATAYVTRFTPKGAKIPLTQALPYFPLVGLIYGTVIFLFSRLAFAVLPHAVAVVVLAVLYPVFLYFVNKGRYLNHLLKVSKFVSKQFDEQDEGEHEVLAHISHHSGLIVLFFFFICKSVVAGILLYFRHEAWLILPALVSSALYAERCGLQNSPDKKSLSPNKIWYLAGIVAFLLQSFTGLAVVCMAWLLGCKSLEWATRNEKDLLTVLMVSVCEIMECVVILFGLFII